MFLGIEMMEYKKFIAGFLGFLFFLIPQLSSGAAFRSWERNGGEGAVGSIAASEEHLFLSGHNVFGRREFEYSNSIEKMDIDSGDILETASVNLAGVGSVITASDFDGDNLYVAGNYLYQNGSFRGFVAKLDDSLNVIWSSNHVIIGAITGLAADGDFVYFSGYDVVDRRVRWVLKKIDKNSGEIIDSLVIDNARPYDLKIRIEDDGRGNMVTRLFVVGVDYSDNQSRWRTEIRNDDLGLIIEPVFSNAGNGSYAKASAFWLQPGGSHGIFVVGYTGSNWRVEKRASNLSPCSQGNIVLDVCGVSFGETYLRYEYKFNVGRAVGNALRFTAEAAVLEVLSLASSIPADVINYFKEIEPIPIEEAWMWVSKDYFNPLALFGNVAHAGFWQDAWDGFKARRGNNIDLVIKQEGGEGHIDLVENDRSATFDSVSSIASANKGDSRESVFFLNGTKNGQWLTQRRDGSKGAVNWNQYGGESGSPLSSLISIEGEGDQLVLYSSGAVNGFKRIEETKNKLESGDVIRTSHVVDIAREINRVRNLSGFAEVDFSDIEDEVMAGKVVRAEHFTILTDSFRNRCSADPVFENDPAEPNAIINPRLLNELALRLNAGVCQDYQFRLDQNFPNPFDSYTTFPFELETEADITLAIYDQGGGRELGKVLDNVRLGKGTYKISISGLNGNNLPSGRYTYKLHSSVQGWLDRGMVVVR